MVLILFHYRDSLNYKDPECLKFMFLLFTMNLSSSCWVSSDLSQKSDIKFAKYKIICKVPHFLIWTTILTVHRVKYSLGLVNARMWIFVFASFLIIKFKMSFKEFELSNWLKFNLHGSLSYRIWEKNTISQAPEAMYLF